MDELAYSAGAIRSRGAVMQGVRLKLIEVVEIFLWNLS